ncbi:glycoside hydrolase superfamily [Tuber brumale]|nr:glycoside hydrolase superfamily [Tuber brumale]
MTSFLLKILLLAILGLSSAAVLPMGTLGARAVGFPINTALPTGKSTAPAQTVAYFGQFGKLGEDSLSKFCLNTNVDIVVLAFVNVYKGAGGLPGMNLGVYCDTRIPGTDLLSCPNIGKDITACQAAGKKVLLSLGGQEANDNSLPDDKSATELGDNLWKLFGEGKGLESKRPFGGALIDGFDIDNENKDSLGYSKLISTLRANFKTGTKKYYISAAPQCPMPDESLDEAVFKVDYLFIQHYNNPACQLGNFVNSFKAWSANIAARTTCGTKVFAGFPGSETASGQGYATHDEMKKYVAAVRGLPNFGGVMVWDGVHAAGNIVSGKSFLQAMREALT